MKTVLKVVFSIVIACILVLAVSCFGLIAIGYIAG